MAERPWMLTHGLVVIGAHDLGLPRLTVDQLLADVRQFHRDSTLAVLLRLNLALTHHNPLDQAQLLRTWLPDVAERFLAVMREQTATEVFHEAQVLNLIRLVILYAPADTGRRCNQMGDFTLLARIMLQLTDVLVEGDGRYERDQRTWVFRAITRTELFMHDERRVPDAMARNYDLFALVPRLLNRRGHGYDLPGTFERITGLAIEDYIGLGFGLLSLYDTLDPGLIGHAEIGIERGRYLANVRLAGRGELGGAGRRGHWPKARARRGARQVSGVGYTTVRDEEEGPRDPRGWGVGCDTADPGGKTLGRDGP